MSEVAKHCMLSFLSYICVRAYLTVYPLNCLRDEIVFKKNPAGGYYGDDDN